MADEQKKIQQLKETEKLLLRNLSISQQNKELKKQEYEEAMQWINMYGKQYDKLSKADKALIDAAKQKVKLYENMVNAEKDINKALDENRKKQQGVTTEIQKQEKALKQLRHETQGILRDNKEVTKEVVKMNKAFSGTSNAAEKLNKSLSGTSKLQSIINTAFIDGERQMKTIADLQQKSKNLTKDELKEIQKYKQAYNNYSQSVAEVHKQLAKKEMTEEQAMERLEQMREGFEDIADGMKFTTKEGQNMKDAIVASAQSTSEFGKKLEQVNKKAADIQSGLSEMKNQIGSTVPMANELLDVFSKIGKVGFAGAMAGLAATAGKFLNEKGLAKKAIPGIKDRLDIENDFKRKNFDEYEKPLAKMNLETDIDFSKQSFDVDQKYAKLDFARQQRMSATMHAINMKNKQIEADFTFKSEASMAYFGKALPSINYAANQLQNAGISAQSIADASVAIASNMGVGGKESAKLGADMAVFAKFAGIGAEEAGSITESFKLMDGASAGTAANMMQGVKAMAEQLDLNPGAVMKEMANASEIALEMNINSGKALAKQVGYASSLGVSFSKIAKAGQNMVLNYKDSIKSEMQLSALLGKQVDLSEVRMKFAEGDTTGAMEALKAQGLDPAQMDMFQKQALQQATGMDIADLSKIGKGKGKDAEALDMAATKIDKASIHAANKHLLAAETTRQIALDNKRFALEQATAAKQFAEQQKMDREAFEDDIKKKREEFDIQQSLARAQLENEITMSRKLQELELQKELANLGNTILFELIPALLAFGGTGGLSGLTDLLSMGKKGKKGGRTNRPRTRPQSSAQRRTAAMSSAAPRPAASAPAAPATRAQQVAQMKAANPGMTSQQALQQVKAAPAGGAPSGPAAAAPKPPTAAPKAPSGGAAPKITAPAAPPAPAMPPAPKIPPAAPISTPKMSWWDKLNPKKFLGKVVNGAGGVGKILGSVAGKVAGPLGSALAGFSMYKDLSALVTMNEGPLPDLYKNVGGSVMSVVGSILGGAIGGSFLGPIGAMLGSTFGSTIFGWLGDLFPGIPTFLGEFLVDTLGLFGKPGSAVPKAEGGGGGTASAPTAAGATSKATAIVGTSQAVKAAAAPTAAPSGGGGAPKSTPAPAAGGAKVATPGATGTSTKGSALAGGLTGMLMGVQLQKIFGPTNSKTEGFIDQAKADSLKQTQAIQLQTKAITNAKGLPTQDNIMQQQLNDLLKVMAVVYGGDSSTSVSIMMDGHKVSKIINKVNSNNDLTGQHKGDGTGTGGG